MSATDNLYLYLAKQVPEKPILPQGLAFWPVRPISKYSFIHCKKLLAILYTSLADDTTDEVIAKLSRLDLLIIDNIGNIRSKNDYPSLLLDLVSSCHGDTTFLVTSGISLEEWGSVLGNTSITNAIIDRLLHRAGVINFHHGRSYRTEGPDSPNMTTAESTSTD